MTNYQNIEENRRNIIEMYKTNIENMRLCRGELMHWALNKALPDGMELKPWDDLNEEQKRLLILHVSDMSTWRGEGKVDANLADYLLEHNSEFLEMMA